MRHTTALSMIAMVLLSMGPVLPETEVGMLDGPLNLERFETAVSYAIEMVRLIAKPDDTPAPPLDATSIIRGYIENGDVMTPSRTNPIPSNWELKATTEHSNIYVAQGQFVPQSDIDAIAETFEIPIYANVTDWFHPQDPPATINIRIYDFGDGAGGVGGFFLASPLTRSDLYVDSQDLRYSRGWAFEIVAHEFQHLLHYDLDPNEDTWLNEGMADLAVRVSLGPGTAGIQSHIDIYESLPENDLIAWDEGEPPDYLGTIADYGRAYAFTSYLTDHFGGKGLVRDILADTRNSIDSIDRLLSARGFEERTWDVVAAEKASNAVDDPIYGGGVYDQGLIDISISSFHATRSSYPYQGTIDGTVRYSGYYLKFTEGDPRLGLVLNSTATYHAAVLGTLGGDVVWSTNLSGGPAVPSFVQLSRFGDLFDTVIVIPHTNVQDAQITVDVKEQELSPPATTVEISPTTPDGQNGYYLQRPGILLTTREGSEVMYAWNDDPFSTATGPMTAPEGTNVLRFYSVGPVTLREEERNLTFKVDTVDPETVLIINPPYPDGNDGYYITSPTVAFDPSTPDDTVRYDLGSGPVTYEGPFDVGAGIWTLTYWGEDPAGRKEVERSMELRVDLNDPDVDFQIVPERPDGSNGYYLARPTVTLTGGAGIDIFYSLSGENFQHYSAPFEIGDGIWDLRFYAQSPSGKRGSTHMESLKVDATPPELLVEFDPPLTEGWSSDNTYMTLTLSDVSDRAFFTIGDGSPIVYSSSFLLTDGTYDITLWAEDYAGNEAKRESISVKVDNNAPVTLIKFDREPENGIWFYDEQPSLDFEPALMPVSEETTFFSVEGSSVFSEFVGQRIELTPGISTIAYYSIDLAGNRETTRTWEVGFDRSPPTPAVKANRTLVPLRGPVRFDLSGSTDDISIYRFRVDFGDGTGSGWVFDDSIVHHYSGLGDYMVRVEVEDTSGRISDGQATLTIEVLTQEEYDRRTESGHGLNWTAIIATLVIASSIIAVAVFIYLRTRRRGQHVAEELEFEIDEEVQ